MPVSRNRRQFSKEFKLQILREVEAGKSVAQAAREHEVHPNCITKWRGPTWQVRFRRLPGQRQLIHCFAMNTYTHEAKVAELERIIGQFAAENTLLKRALKSLEDSRQIPAPQRGVSNVRGEKK